MSEKSSKKPLPILGRAPEPVPSARLLSPPAPLPPRVLRLLLGRTRTGARCLLAASLSGCAADHRGEVVKAPEEGGLDAALGQDAGRDAGADAGDSGPLFGPMDAQVSFPPRGDAATDAALDPRYPFDPRDVSPPACGFGETVIASLPPEGVPAEVDQICTRPATELVASGWRCAPASRLKAGSPATIRATAT